MKTTHSPTEEQVARDARKEQLLIIRKWRIYYITNEITQVFSQCHGKKTMLCFRYAPHCKVWSTIEPTGLCYNNN